MGHRARIKDDGQEIASAEAEHGSPELTTLDNATADPVQASRSSLSPFYI
jgi:hypothetical protein